MLTLITAQSLWDKVLSVRSQSAEQVYA
jgi:hypothetical protein